MVSAAEFEEDLGDHPLRQGDVFRWVDRSHQRPWQTFGVIVTADCDLVNQKIRGRVSYVPGFITEDYIWHYWITGKFDKHYDELTKKLTNRVNKRIQANNGGHGEISTTAVLDWIERSGHNGIVSALNITDNGQIAELARIVDQISTIRQLIALKEPDTQLLKAAHAIRKNISLEKAQSSLHDEFHSSLGSLPGDVFLLPILDGQKQHGLFFMLRHISQCSVENITVRPDDMRSGVANAYRIGRISSPYKYAMMQNLAKVFTDIGLPSNYKDRCRKSTSFYFTQEA